MPFLLCAIPGLWVFSFVISVPWTVQVASSGAPLHICVPGISQCCSAQKGIGLVDR